MNETKEKNTEEGIDLAMVLVHVLYSSFAFLAAGSAITLPFVFLPMLMSHLRLEEPWPKVTALLGAAVALVVFKLPVSLVLVVFVLGIFVGEGVKRKTPYWRLSAQALGLALGVAVGYLFLVAQLEGLSVVSYWKEAVAGVMENFGKVEVFGQVISASEFEQRLTIQAPFFFLFLVGLILWASVGIAAHFNWFPKSHPLRSSGLRALSLPSAVIISFLVLFVSRFWRDTAWFLFADGAFLVVGVFVYVQGTVVLSNFLARKGVSRPLRALTYAVSLTLGFYALMGMGLVSQWVLRDKKNTVSGGGK